MNGTLRFRLDDEEGCVLAEVNVCFEGVEELKTAHSMVDNYLYHLEDKLERGKMPLWQQVNKEKGVSI